MSTRDNHRATFEDIPNEDVVDRAVGPRKLGLKNACSLRRRLDVRRPGHARPAEVGTEWFLLSRPASGRPPCWTSPFSTQSTPRRASRERALSVGRGHFLISPRALSFAAHRIVMRSVHHFPNTHSTPSQDRKSSCHLSPNLHPDPTPAPAGSATSSSRFRCVLANAPIFSPGRRLI